jgi:hypothetical protein
MTVFRSNASRRAQRRFQAKPRVLRSRLRNEVLSLAALEIFTTRTGGKARARTNPTLDLTSLRTLWKSLGNRLRNTKGRVQRKGGNGTEMTKSKESELLFANLFGYRPEDEDRAGPRVV